MKIELNSRRLDLRDRLLQEDAQEQLLVWLVRGAVAWYKNRDLITRPPVMLAAYHAYSNENDKLQHFIETYCETDESYYVNAGEFRRRFNKTMGTEERQTDLINPVAKKGFKYCSPKIDHKSQKIYRGLRFLRSKTVSEE
ncbi:hypothetical protein BGX26_006286 [Mortierella sp. AD094]|nr:hypothetical protein BGX26_006286 [Mortierella sp. AD094]